MDMSGNSVLITGGASGIGFALARRFMARSNIVVVCGRRERLLEEAQRTLPGLRTIRANLAESTERENPSTQMAKQFPALNILINNAGIQQRPPPLTESQDWSRHRQELAINLEAPTHLSMLLTPLLGRQAAAAIVNVTSKLAFVPLATMPTYCASKAALHSFTLSLRHQLRSTSI